MGALSGGVTRFSSITGHGDASGRIGANMCIPIPKYTVGKAGIPWKNTDWKDRTTTNGERRAKDVSALKSMDIRTAILTIAHTGTIIANRQLK